MNEADRRRLAYAIRAASSLLELAEVEAAFTFATADISRRLRLELDQAAADLYPPAARRPEDRTAATVARVLERRVAEDLRRRTPR